MLKKMQLENAKEWAEKMRDVKSFSEELEDSFVSVVENGIGAF